MLSLMKNLSGIQLINRENENEDKIVFAFNSASIGSDSDIEVEINIDPLSSQVAFVKVLTAEDVIPCKDIVEMANEIKDIRRLVHELKYRIIRFIQRKKEVLEMNSRLVFLVFFFFLCCFMLFFVVLCFFVFLCFKFFRNVKYSLIY
jgi:hypothetical protein